MTLDRVVRFACVTALASVSACSPGYVLRAGWEEAKILSARRPIHEMVHDTTTPEELRAKLRLVQHSREYARRALDLEPGDAFTSYVELERDTLVMVLNAAHEFQLRWKTWWFPIVGRLPYKGYFDFARARQEAAELDAQGFDTWVRPSGAFSTLGWLPDPLMSTTLRADSVGIVETVIHEITHSTFFPKGQARFNESFANFVGHRGAISFYCDALADGVLCETAEDRWHDIRVFGRFFHSVVDPLEDLYATDLPPEEMREEKRRILRAAAARFEEEVQPEFRSGRYRGLDPEQVNNAWLLSRMLYYTRLDDMQSLFERYGDLAVVVREVMREAGGGDPWDALDRLLAGPGDSAVVPSAR
jgi:predicted aminopeptidase